MIFQANAIFILQLLIFFFHPSQSLGSVSSGPTIDPNDQRVTLLYDHGDKCPHDDKQNRSSLIKFTCNPGLSLVRFKHSFYFIIWYFSIEKKNVRWNIIFAYTNSYLPYCFWDIEGLLSIIFIIVGNGIGNLGSKPEQGCLCFILC